MDRLRVLVVDDDPLVQRALGLLVERFPDCAVIDSVATASDALSAAARLRPDVVLLDAELPDALSTVALLRGAARERGKNPRIVLLSVYGRGERAALASGADAYLLKDCGPAELAAALSSQAPCHQRARGTNGTARGRA